ncbi:hypothetical protein V5799_000865 [Amblyomma americanum]|uniref:Uncharacterized protein n=1 Tax=Amblyomma americanum TaxID=6943 RepID=A0AAQ4D1U3_AMBAM
MQRGGDAATAAAQRVICWANEAPEDVEAQSGTLLGLVLAFANVFFNASSFVIKKHALRRLVEGSSADVAQGLALQFTSSTAVVAIGMGNGLVTGPFRSIDKAPTPRRSHHVRELDGPPHRRQAAGAIPQSNVGCRACDPGQSCLHFWHVDAACFGGGPGDPGLCCLRQAFLNSTLCCPYQARNIH